MCITHPACQLTNSPRTWACSRHSLAVRLNSKAWNGVQSGFPSFNSCRAKVFVHSFHPSIHLLWFTHSIDLIYPFDWFNLPIQSIRLTHLIINSLFIKWIHDYFILTVGKVELDGEEGRSECLPRLQFLPTRKHMCPFMYPYLLKYLSLYRILRFWISFPIHQFYWRFTFMRGNLPKGVPGKPVDYSALSAVKWKGNNSIVPSDFHFENEKAWPNSGPKVIAGFRTLTQPLAQ